MKTRAFTLTAILGLNTLALSLACTGTPAADGVVDGTPEPTPVPEPDRGKGGKRGGRDRDGDGDGGGGGGGGRGQGCDLTHFEASSATDGHEGRLAGDDDLTTSWCEGASGTGIGQTLTWDVPAGCTFDTMELWNGNFENAGALSGNNRLKRIRVYETAADETQFDLDDPTGQAFEKAKTDPEELDLPAALRNAKTLSIRIDAVYGGTKDNGCVSQIRLKQK